MILGLLAAAAVATCAPRGMDRAALDALKANGFQLADAPARRAFALEVADCLGDPDPAVRDGIAFEGLQSLMRRKALDTETLRALRDRSCGAFVTIAGMTPRKDGATASRTARTC